MAPFSPTFKNINQPYYYIHFIILIAIAETFSLLRQKCVVVFVNLYLTSVCPGLHLYIRGAAWVVGRVLPETQRYYLWLIILMISVSNRSGPHLNHQIIFVSLKFSGDCRVLYLDTYIEFEYLLVVCTYCICGQGRPLVTVKCHIRVSGVSRDKTTPVGILQSSWYQLPSECFIILRMEVM